MWLMVLKRHGQKSKKKYLKAHYNHPDHSASMIAIKVKKTRSAVIGKARRMGLNATKETQDKITGKRKRKTPSLKNYGVKSDDT